MTERKRRQRLEADLPESIEAGKLDIRENTGNVYADLRVADAK